MIYIIKKYFSSYKEYLSQISRPLGAPVVFLSFPLLRLPVPTGVPFFGKDFDARRGASEKHPKRPKREIDGAPLPPNRDVMKAIQGWNGKDCLVVPEATWSACPEQTGKAIFTDDFSDDSVTLR